MMAPSTSFPGNIGFYLTLIAFISLFLFLAGLRVLVIAGGKREDRLGTARDIVERIVTLPSYVLATMRLNRSEYWYAGLLHTMILWGFLVLQVRTLNFLLDGFHEAASLESIFGILYTGFRPVMELFNILVIFAVGLAAFQRIFIRPARLSLNWDAWFILFLTWFLMVTDVFTNSFAIVLDRGDRDAFSFMAFGLANLWDAMGISKGVAEGLHGSWWYLHLFDFLTFLAYLPISKHSHILTAPFNVFFRRLTPTGVLQPIENIEEQEVFGVGKIQDFSWKQNLDFYTCTECGRCEINCPAFNTGKDLSPKKIMVEMRAVAESQMRQSIGVGGGEEPLKLIDAVGFDAIWDCVSCGACQYQCPVYIEHVPALMDMRRFLVMDEANMPETAASTLKQLEQRGHPWPGAAFTRTSWMEEMEFEIPKFDGSQEYLFWVGCTGAMVERNVKVTQALARLLREAGVSFGCLGEEETCSGDPARRLGNEYLYQIQAGQNIETWKQKGVQKVVTTCPHCFNTMKNEYPQFDGHFEVRHHTEVLAELIADGKLQVTHELAEKVTYHDSCFLGRHNDIYEPPRDIIKAIPGAELQEIEGQCREKGFCCGAGGGHMWMEESKGERINNARCSQAQSCAESCGSKIIAANCPFCIQMLEDGFPSVQPDEEKRLKTYDVAELLAQAVFGDGNGAAPVEAAAAVAAEGDGAPAEAETDA
ncbi:MAG: 4Fe-4S dicluster domain-containing protein [Chloroflexi bacterium]|nr:4Fe-4S dicluster domain-containing protein [Chloroflexota bacterium]